jgi:hypothetical protein
MQKMRKAGGRAGAADRQADHMRFCILNFAFCIVAVSRRVSGA